ncbi:uncharacterized protein MONBRDRAFT_11637 [Monosiga brevicollis MX1]|uniref:STAS domain-containing protein n=1 Tax=Monosiga brevicollis TaxID=81824 RepID=A9V9V2_MONBE|nr:uncharacterized protein MONBRDRAFT_11637 [Monosiga brevicollis MX1]EDQ85788.1 predicted protein [Monosiga brevicollis MX1]|eukprot:XP_001749503.1 hypothetical protein [Monosiga brevicollis MX1]
MALSLWGQIWLCLTTAQVATQDTAQKVATGVAGVSRATASAVLNGPGQLVTKTKETVAYYRAEPTVLRRELVSGFTIAVLQIPESVAFSFVAGLDPIYGLRATIFLGFIAGLIGSRPGMVSGAAGAMAVILADLTGPGGEWRDGQFTDGQVDDLVNITLMITGAMQVGLALFGLARFARLIPFTAMIGFMNGLAIIILISQLTAFQECPNDEYAVCARADTLKWMRIDDGRTWMVILESLMSAAIVVFFPLWRSVHRYVPAALVSLVVVTAFEHAINRTAIDLPTRTVGETAPLAGGFEAPRFPNKPAGAEWGTICLYAAIMTMVGAIESIMTSEAVAELLQEPNNRWASTQECVAQGIGNFISGLFSSMGGDAMIGQSTVNVMNGARHRLSTTSASVFLLIIVVALSRAIEVVPVACLTGILFVIVTKTFHWPTFRLLFQLSWPDSLGIILVTVLAVTTNLAYAVLAGVVWRALVHAYASGELIHCRTELRAIQDGKVLAPLDSDEAGNETGNEAVTAELNRSSSAAQLLSTNTTAAVSADEPLVDTPPVAESNVDTTAASTGPATRSPAIIADANAVEKVYYFSGPLFFGSATAFRGAFDPAHDPQRIVIDFTAALVSDFSAVTALRGVCKRYQQLGKEVIIQGLDAHSRTHMQRHRKLRYLAEEDQSLEDEGVPAEPPHHLNSLHIFQPEGDEIGHFSMDASGDDAVAELYRSNGDASLNGSTVRRRPHTATSVAEV